MTESRPALDDPDFMRALLDILVPQNGDVPGAGTLGLAPDVAEGLRADPMLGPFAGPGVDGVREAALGQNPEGLPGMMIGDAKAFVSEQFAANPMLPMGLLRHLYPAYYALPQVLKAIGDPPRPPFPEGYQADPTDPALLAKLEARKKAP
jgi:hypothetical protein